MEKSFVTIRLCPICHKEDGLLLDRRLKQTFERETVTPEPCEACRKKYLTNGVMLINPETGRLVVIKDEAFKRIFTCPMPPKKIAFCHDDILEKFTAGENEKNE